MRALIALLPGDGIGPEVTFAGVQLLRAVAERSHHEFQLETALIGGAAIDATGSPLPDTSLALCRRADAVLLGAVGGPKWAPSAKVRPEQGLLALRKEMGLFANLRPVTVHPRIAPASPIKTELLADVDFVVVRELTGGIYFGEKTRTAESASDLCTYSAAEVRRVVRAAARLAQKRRHRLTSVDKANVLETSRLWRDVTTQVVQDEFPDLQLEHVLVDSCAMLLVQRPSRFDVIVTENMFGDILTDEAAVLAGSIGLLPSASLGEGTKGVYEPVHGSAPDIAGKGIAKTNGTLLSVAMLLRHSLGLVEEAHAVERAVHAAIEQGVLTPDLSQNGVTTQQATDAVLNALRGGAGSAGVASREGLQGRSKGER
ncbi:MAG: 3-isopropylmalate dehydrogenase [Myxococcales bacterium]